MPTNKPFYITTTLPYVNADPHIGFAMEIIRADVIARAKKLAGYDVFFNTGTDEHGIKIYRKAQEQHIDTQTYVDGLSLKYKHVLTVLGITPEINFIRTTDAHHKKSAQAFWDVVNKNGYIYKKNYSTKYCVGCELEKTDSELVNGKCPLHPLQELEIIEEENYFFKFSAFEQKLLELYEKNPTFVIPDFRFNEIKSLVTNGLKDFSISRLAKKMQWGIPVPGDPDQVMYVWFDALVDYISAIGWPDDEVSGKQLTGSFKKWWIDTGGVVQYCGKDNLRQQSAMWQAMLMAAGLTPSKNIVVDGFITGDGGIKMSKSLGNTVDPLDIVKAYSTDALRYYMVRELTPFEDGAFTMEKFKEAYNANLANGIGNLTSRIMKMAEANSVALDKKHFTIFLDPQSKDELIQTYFKGIETYDLKSSADAIWKEIARVDVLIQENQPFKLVKSEKDAEREKGLEVIMSCLEDLYTISLMLKPFMPATAEAILKCLFENKTPSEPLFMRK